ncbi:MAG: hypothetical protein LAT67_02385 [Balneolales bacterium]|nr:hypothetical protein [Balneolales bacterium]
MTQAVQRITERLQRKLTHNQEYFTPAELIEVGIPDFVVARIQLELEKNLADSIVPPRTDWANMNAAEVTGAWQQFLDAIHNQLRLPHSFAKGVIENSVADLLDVLIEPRKNLGAYIFGNDDILNKEEAMERMRWVVVYRHFGTFLPRYMKNKQLEVISRQRYENAVSQIDRKLCAQYSPLNWAQLINPIFIICNGEIDPELLTRFFNDKEMPKIAARFDAKRDTVDKQLLIEVLSSPVFEDNEDDSNSYVPLSYGQPVQQNRATEEESFKKAEKDQEKAAEQEHEHEPEIRAGHLTDEPDAKEEQEAITLQRNEPKSEPSPQDESKSSMEEALSDFLNYTFKSTDELEGSEKEPESAEENTKEEPETTLGSNFRSSASYEENKDEDDEEEEVPFYKRYRAEADTEDDSIINKKTVIDEEDEDRKPLFSQFTFDEEETQEEESFADNETSTPDYKNPADEQDLEELVGNASIFSPGEDESKKKDENNDAKAEIVEEKENEKEKDEEIDDEPIYKKFRLSDDEEPGLGSSGLSKSGIKSPEPAHNESDNNEDDDVPLWKRLLEKEDDSDDTPIIKKSISLDSTSVGSRQGQAAYHAEEKEEQLRRSIAEPENNVGDRYESLKKYLKSGQKEFIRDIFKGDEQAYSECLEQMATYKSWREAGKYLTNEIFRKNKIDIYKDVTVDFTDNLHRFFMKSKS